MAVNRTHNDGTIIGPAGTNRNQRRQQQRDRRGGANDLENLQTLLHNPPTRDEVNARAAAVYQDDKPREQEPTHTQVQDAVIKSITAEAPAHLVVSLGEKNADEQLSQPIAQTLNEQTKDINMTATTASKKNNNAAQLADDLAFNTAQSLIKQHAKTSTPLPFDLGNNWLGAAEADKNVMEQVANLRDASNVTQTHMQMMNNRINHLEGQLALTKAAMTSAAANKAKAATVTEEESFGIKLLKIGAVGAVYSGCVVAAVVGVTWAAGKLLGDDVVDAE